MGRIWRGVLLLLAVSCAHAAAPGGVDVVLVLDSSGSMKRTDPQRLRVEAGRLFVSLLQAGDRVGVVSFSDQGYPVAPLTPVDDAAGRTQLYAALEKVSSRGMHTNLHAALASAHDMLQTQSEAARRRAVILLSDGKMDVGDVAQDAALTTALTGELVPAFTAGNIPLHTIAFSEEADTPLLTTLAQQGGGMFRLAQQDHDLAEVFAALFENSEQPDMLPLIGGEFLVDAALEEVTILAMKDQAEVAITLATPDGQQHTAQSHAAGMAWQAATHFELVTVPQPTPGKWRILASSGNNRAYVVTHLQLDTSFAPRLLAPGSEVLLEVWLARDGGRVELPEILQGVRIALELQGPDGILVRQWLNDAGTEGDVAAGDGIFSAPLAVTAAGSYVLRLVADGGTFNRQLMRYFDVTAAAVAEPSPLPPPVAVAPAAEASPPPDAEAAPACPEPPPAEIHDTGSALWWFAVGNLSLLLMAGLVAGGVVLARKRRLARLTAVKGGEDDGAD